MTINFYIFVFLGFLILLVLPFLILVFTKNNYILRKILMILFSCLYFLILFFGTICVINTENNYITFSFEFNWEWFKISFLVFNFSLSNIFINLSMFLPLGLIVYTFTSKRPFLKTIVYALLISILIEIYQAILPVLRDSEIGDIIMNTISGLLSANGCLILNKLNIF